MPLQINISIALFFITLGGFVFAFINIYHNITKDGEHFRTGFFVLLLFTGLLTIAIVSVVQPIELACILTAIGFPMACGALVLFVYLKQRSPALAQNDKVALTSFHLMKDKQVRILAAGLVNSRQGRGEKPPIPAGLIPGILDKYEEILRLKVRGRTVFHISVLQTFPNGKFKVLATSQNIDADSSHRMEAKFNWETPAGSAGDCARTARSVLCTDLGDEQSQKDSYWIPLEDEKPRGGILCLPIPFPINYTSPDPKMKCLGVLSISCSARNYLSIPNHEEWTQTALIPVLASIILLYMLNDS